MRLTAKQFQEATKPAKPRKYRNKPTWVDGIRFDSAKEARRYGELKAMETAGLISDLELQPKFPLEVDGRPVLIRSKGYPNGRRAGYKADFRYRQDGRVVVEDVKSQPSRTEAYVLRKAFVEAIYNIKVVEI